jgi:hypothetical protein
MATQFSVAISASDFSDRTTDSDRHCWTLGKFRHLVAALDGAPVAIVTDARTGHTEVGVRLVKCFDGGPDRGPRLTIERELADGQIQRTNYRVTDIGETIIPLVPGWFADAARRTHGRERSEAIRLARAEHGECEGRCWGEWTARVELDVVAVTYTPYTGLMRARADAGERGYWSYPLARLSVAEATC